MQASLIVGFHTVPIGIHWNIERRNTGTNHSIFSQRKANIAVRLLDPGMGAKIRINRRRMESFVAVMAGE